MSDDVDRAQHIEQRERDAQLAAVRAITEGRGSATCEDCGTVNPEPRRKAVPWAVRCVDCQEHDDLQGWFR